MAATASAKRPVIVRKPVELRCTSKGCKGITYRVDLSRLEEGLGHEGFECGHCHRRVKYVPGAL